MQKRVDALTEENKELRFRLGSEQAADVNYRDWQSRNADLTAQLEQLRLAHRALEEELSAAHRRQQDEQVRVPLLCTRSLTLSSVSACAGFSGGRSEAGEQRAGTTGGTAASDGCYSASTGTIARQLTLLSFSLYARRRWPPFRALR